MDSLYFIPLALRCVSGVEYKGKESNSHFSPVVLLGSIPAAARTVAQGESEFRTHFQYEAAVLLFYLCC